MTSGQPLNDADAQYLAHIWDDCEICLGPNTEMLGLHREPGDEGVRLVARYLLGKNEHESVAVGATLLAAHKALRGQIVTDRVRFGFSELVTRR